MLVAPGGLNFVNPTGTLSFGNGLTFGSGGVLALDLGAISSGGNYPGTGWDFVSVNGGDLSIVATTGVPFMIKLQSITSGGVAGPIGGFDPTQPYSWQFAAVSGGGTVTQFDSTKFIVGDAGFLAANNLMPGAGLFSVSLGGAGGNTALYLNFTPVPEPSTWALLLCGASAVLLPALRRRRR